MLFMCCHFHFFMMMIDDNDILIYLTDNSARNYRPSFRENKPNTFVSMTENERFGIVFTKTRVYKLGHRISFEDEVYPFHFNEFEDNDVMMMRPDHMLSP
jgi:hypothetical protein